MSKLNYTVPKIFISARAKLKMDLYIKHATGEISGLGTVDKFDNNFIIKDVFIFNQECTATTTDLSAEDIGNFIVDAVRQKLDPSSLKLFWHSHANMQTFWSGTDTNTIDRISNSWMISIVGNKSKNYLTRLDLYDFVRLTIDELPLEVYQPEDEELEANIIAEVNEKVKSKPVTAYVGRYINGENGSFFPTNDVRPVKYWDSQYNRKKENAGERGEEDLTPEEERIINKWEHYNDNDY